MTIRTARSVTIDQPLERTLTAFLYDVASADPHPATMRSTGTPGEYQVVIDMGRALAPVVGEVSVRHGHGTARVLLSSSNAQGRFAAEVILRGRGAGTTEVRAVASVTPAGRTTVRLTQASQAEVWEGILARTRAIAGQLARGDAYLNESLLTTVRQAATPPATPGAALC